LKSVKNRYPDTDMLDNSVFVRLRGKKVVGLTITNFSHKFKDESKK